MAISHSEEGGATKDGKVKTNRRKSGKSLSPPRSSGSGRSKTRQRRNSSRSTSRDDLSLRSTRSSDSFCSTKSGKGSSSHESRQAAVKELKDELKAEGKQGDTNTQLDTKGNKVYEWGQNDSCVLLYIAWPFEFEFGANTKFECKISKDTLLLKGKHKKAKATLQYTTGGLVKAKLSEWCVVSKGKASNGDGETFAIEVTLFKKNVGLEWKTALFEDPVGLPESPGSLSSRKGSRRGARSTSPMVTETKKFSEGQIVYYTSSDGQNKEIAKILKVHLDDDLVPFFDIRLVESGKEKQTTDSHLSRHSDDLFSDRSDRSISGSSHSTSERGSQPTPSKADRQQLPEKSQSSGVPQKSRFVENEVVCYTNNGQTEKAKILKIHLDDDLVPFYDIQLIDSGKEKQTTDARLSSLTDEVPPPGLARAVSAPVPSDRQVPEKAQSNGVPQKSRFVEHEVVCYTNNGQQEKAEILKIHLDDDLIPFYDIRLIDSGKEKQTTDARLSSLTDEVQPPVLARAISDGPPTPSDRQLPEKTQSTGMPQKSRFVENEVVCYTNNGQTEKAKILKIHLDDDLIPFYDIQLIESGKEKQTTDARLSSLTDEVQPPRLARAVSDGPLASKVDRELPEKGQSNGVPQKSRFVEDEVVYYTSNGQKEKAKILKIYLDDDLIPFYDIRLEDSGKEKQTTDSHISKAEAQGRRQSGSSTSELPPPPPPVRKPPGRSRSMNAGTGAAVGSASPGPSVRKGRRGFHRQSSPMPSAPSQASGEEFERKGPPVRKLPDRSRSMDGDFLQSPGSLKKGRRVAGRRQSIKSGPVPSASGQPSSEDSAPKGPPTRKSSGRRGSINAGGSLHESHSPVRRTSGRRGSINAGGSLHESHSPVRRTSGRRGSINAGGSLHTPGPPARKLSGRSASVRTPNPPMRKSSDRRGSTKPPNETDRRQSGSSASEPLVRKLPSRSRSMNAGASTSPGPIFRKGRRGCHRGSTPLPSAAGQTSCEESERNKGPPVRKLPDRSRSMDGNCLQSPGSLKNRRVAGRRQSIKSGPVPAAPPQASSTLDIAHIKILLKEYGGMSPATYNYANEDQMIAAWNFIEADSKRSVGRIKKELRDLGQSTEYVDKNELIGALCKARLEQKASGRSGDKLCSSDRAPHPSSSDNPEHVRAQRRGSLVSNWWKI